MSEAQEQPGKPDYGRALLLGAGLGCLGVFFNGLAETFGASHSGSAIHMAFAVLGMAFGGIGAACVGRAVFTKRP
jgi:hypothetical protein